MDKCNYEIKSRNRQVEIVLKSHNYDIKGLNYDTQLWDGHNYDTNLKLNLNYKCSYEIKKYDYESK